jgi:H/ACA ribonucleoprotein complex subunit 4
LHTALPWATTREMVSKVEDVTDPKYGCRPEDRALSIQIKYGMINVDKPPGPSSHEVVAWIKRMMRLSHAGHGGTLETQLSG